MSSKLILALDGEILREYENDREFMSIGRKHENDIQLNDLTVSGRHALISKVGDHVYIEDLNSTNGIYINGISIVRCSLRNHDHIQIGNVKILFKEETRTQKI